MQSQLKQTQPAVYVVTVTDSLDLSACTVTQLMSQRLCLLLGNGPLHNSLSVAGANLCLWL